MRWRKTLSKNIKVVNSSHVVRLKLLATIHNNPIQMDEIYFCFLEPGSILGNIKQQINPFEDLSDALTLILSVIFLTTRHRFHIFKNNYRHTTLCPYIVHYAKNQTNAICLICITHIAVRAWITAKGPDFIKWIYKQILSFKIISQIF